MKTVNTRDAVGMILCHDMTQIIPGKSKGPRFRKGHTVQEEDIEVLLSMGKEQLYVYEPDENTYHENEAAEILAKIALNDHMSTRPPKEGKVDIIAEEAGLLKVDTERLFQINSIDALMMATKKTNSPVEKGYKLAGTRVIPLIIDREPVDRAYALRGDEPILKLLPYRNLKAAIVTTGNEVYTGRIKDGFTDVIRKKIAPFGMTEIGHALASDDKKMIEEKIRGFIADGAEIVFCTGGMSVDPDDNTPGAISAVADRIITYGSPVLPGAMFMLAYAGEVPIVGLPGCVMFCGRTVFDMILPRLAAKDPVTREEIAELGHGGLL